MKVNELTKTGIFIAGAAVAVLIAWAATWTQPSFEPEYEVGNPLFADPEDPNESISLVGAADLEVLGYNEKTATVSTIRFTKTDGKWVVATHDDYPTDPEAKPVDEAVAALVDLRILGVESDNLGDRTRYGVVDPGAEETRKELKTGVGTRVIVKDAEGNLLVDLVIGKKVEDESLEAAARGDEDGDPRELHYVRRPEHNRIYTVAVNTRQQNEQGEEIVTYSTAFRDWVAQDLMDKFDSYSLKQMVIQAWEMLSRERGGPGFVLRYSIPILASYIDLKYEDHKWQLVEERTYQGRDDDKPVWNTATELAEDEELSVPSPYELGEKLKGLTIVDVRQKPEALSHVLETEGENALGPDGAVMANTQLLEPLNRVGFDIPSRDEQRQELYGEGGVLRYLTDEGIEYTLRFSRAFTDIKEAMAGRARKEKPEPDKPEPKAAEGEEPGEAEKEDAKKDSPKDSQQRRFLLVTTRFVQDAVPEPEIKPVPEITAEQKPEEKPEGEPKAKQPADKEAAKEKPAQEEPTGQSADPASAGEPSAAQPEDAPEADKPQPKEPPEEPKPVEEPEARPTAKPEEAEPAAKQEPEEEEEEEKVTKEEVDEIIKENEEAQKRYDEKVNEGQELVAELNARYAKWFYIVPEEDYQKIFLTRDEIIKEKEVEPKEGPAEPTEPTAGPDEPETKPEPAPKAKARPAPGVNPEPGPAAKPEPDAKVESKPEPAPEAKPAAPKPGQPETPDADRSNPLRSKPEDDEQP